MTASTSEYQALAERVIQVRTSIGVERVHTWRHLGRYSNAEHQWGATVLLHQLWPEDFPRLALVMVTHDVPESWTGDTPGGLFRLSPGLTSIFRSWELKLSGALGVPSEHNLSPEDMAKVKACDRLELWLWLNEQLAQGNMFAQNFLDELEDFFAANPLPDRALLLKDAIQARGVLPRQMSFLREVV